MSLLSTTLNRLIDYSIYDPQKAPEAKLRISLACERTKTVAAVVAFATPVFALFLPTLFCLVVSVSFAAIAYDLFNIANNLSNAARNAAQGLKAPHSGSHLERIIENTQFVSRLYKWMIA